MRALILGIGGQDGSYLAEHLLSLGYSVHGVVRRSSVDNLVRINPFLEKITLHTGDLCDGGSIERALSLSLPGEVYNLADQDHVRSSHCTPDFSADVTYGAVGRLLESVLRVVPKAKVFQACSATMFGMTPPPQNEESAHDPRSPYAVSKLAAYHLCRHYRRRHGLFVTTGVLFNHDSPRRHGDYLLHTVVKGLRRVCRREMARLHLDNPDLRVDVGHAKEFVVGYHKLLQLDEPTDVCIGTGVGWRIREMAWAAAQMAWKVQPWESGPRMDDLVEWGTSTETPPELRADCRKLERLTGWMPAVDVIEVLRELVEHYKDKSCV